ncbi:unnamed protein product [Gongylonema pulchrum]|uniref:G_PROTEIN_RECEP_F2_4 domain-containing protein n=1 Tax=Gongylonema pulchrum TaxID=637853 RepID=A0A183D0K6_9BILA|nr:unnamed protein product [Gongylonema pulchrum]
MFSFQKLSLTPLLIGRLQFAALISSCKVVTALWNYFILCSYFWIFVEGLYLHNAIYFNIFVEPKVSPYAFIGWGTFTILLHARKM